MLQTSFEFYFEKNICYQTVQYISMNSDLYNSITLKSNVLEVINLLTYINFFI